MKIAIAVGGLVLSALGVGTTFWSDGCTTTPPRHWLTPMEIESRLRENGLKLQSMRADEDRCFAIVASEKNGKLRAILVNPADGTILRNEPHI